MDTIKSERITLIPLNASHLKVWHLESRSKLEICLNLNPNNWLTQNAEIEAETTDALENYWLPETLKNPEKYFWFTNWEIVLNSQNISIGGIGFGGYPASGKTPVGYIIDEKYQNNGYATEALKCLISWAFLNPALNLILADTPTENWASQKVLLNNGFVKIGNGEAEHNQKIEVFHWQKTRFKTRKRLNF